jgi:hypothetical protein
VATAAVSSTNIAAVDSIDVSRFVVYRRYKSGHRTLPFGTPRVTGEISVHSIAAFS